MISRFRAVTTLLALASALPALALNVVNGASNENPTTDLVVSTDTTLQVPDSGRLVYRTIRIDTGATLRFTPNAANTPVYLLATGNVLIDGSINVDGKAPTSTSPGQGGPGGFAGGMPGTALTAAGDGLGPGGGLGSVDNRAGKGGYGNMSGDSYLRGASYGSALVVPLVGGSGGGGVKAANNHAGGGGGGGAILIASNSIIQLNGSVSARSRDVACNQAAGSGGAVRLVAPVVSGAGSVDVTGGTDTCTYAAGQGRIRVDTLDRAAISLTYYPNSTTAAVGGFLVVYPDNLPKLEIIEAAGSPMSGSAPVTIILPTGASSSQTVKLRVTNFPGAVSYRVRVTPEAGAATSYDGTIPAGSSEALVDVTIPGNNLTRIDAWTR